ncbi:MAG: hypothetical protein ACTHU0_21845 [Kofleriaceae bacterium]
MKKTDTIGGCIATLGTSLGVYLMLNWWLFEKDITIAHPRRPMQLALVAGGTAALLASTAVAAPFVVAGKVLDAAEKRLAGRART